MRSLVQSLQSKRPILLGKRKILGKYFQGNRSYLKWNGFLLLLLIFQVHTVFIRKHTPSFWTYTQSCARDTDAHTNGFSSDAVQCFMDWSVLLPCHLTNWHACLFFPFLKIQHFPPNGKGLCVPGKEDKKGRKISTSLNLHQNKNKQT